MEIFSYVGTRGEGRATARVLSSPSRKRRLQFPQAIKTLSYDLSFVAKKLFILVYIVPLGLLMSLSVVAAKKIYTTVDSKMTVVKLLPLEEISDEGLMEVERLFALGGQKDIQDCVDESGKVKGAAAPLPFREAVTYSTYTVKSGDTISGITSKLGLSNISTLIAINNIENVRVLRAGLKLKVPSCDGLLHTMASGESLTSLSAKYNCALEDILDVNELSTSNVAVGTSVFIPGAAMSKAQLQKAMGETFIMPLSVKFRYTSMFGAREDPFTGVKTYHKGIDMACPTGTPIKAVMGGQVMMTSYSNIYGNYVIINHGNGYQTLYGHMSKKVAKGGQYVSQGQVIGYVGSTGYSTGPHLHLSVFKNNKVVDPMTVIKAK